MSTFFVMAWRNVWRNLRRSIITILAVSVGLGALIFTYGFSAGMHEQMIAAAVRGLSGHVQVHERGYMEDKDVELAMSDPKALATTFQRLPNVRVVTPRVIGQGLLSSPENSAGVMILGIAPATERGITHFHEKIIQGANLSTVAKEGRRKEILIGTKLRKSLKVGLGDKVVIMTQAADGSLGSDLYSVAGVFNTGSAIFDRSLAIIHIRNAQELLALDGRVTEFAILLDSAAHASATAAVLKAQLSPETFEVHTWDEINPDILAFIEIDDASFFIIILIVFTVVALGIMNTMLMSIFERVREFGIMMALGAKPRQVVLLVVLEAILLGCIAIVVGTLLGSGVTYYYSVEGIDLRSFIDSVQMVGITMEPVLRPKLIGYLVVKSILVVFTLTVGVSLYPAAKAARLKPIEAIHYV